MTNVWTLVGMCLEDARRANDLMTDPRARRVLRERTEQGLADFALWRMRRRAR